MITVMMHLHQPCKQAIARQLTYRASNTSLLKQDPALDRRFSALTLPVMVLCCLLAQSGCNVQQSEGNSEVHFLRPSGAQTHNVSKAASNSNVIIDYLECGLCTAFTTPFGAFNAAPGYCYAVFSIRTVDNTANNDSFTFVPTDLHVENYDESVFGQVTNFAKYVSGANAVVQTELTGRQSLSYTTDALAAAVVKCDDKALRSTTDYKLLYRSTGNLKVQADKAKPPPFWKNVGDCKSFADGFCLRAP